ncbi:MAG: sugar phosphate isomerase/epimerase [Candidatus Hydrogenedentes bacterium]|nr:sugar phosphate isomerase/epimerase [Candidatus Hydrogenedentota bacterium]
MLDSLHDYMRVGIVHFMAFPQCAGGVGPIVKTISAIAFDPFFDVIEISHTKSEAHRKEIRALAEQSRIEICFGAQPILLGGGLDLNHPDNGERARAIEAVMNAIDEAFEVGSKTVAVLSGKVTDDKSAAMSRLTESLMELCEYAKTKAMSVTLETFDQVPFGKNCLIGPTKDAVAVSEAVRKHYSNFGIMLDLSHLPLQEESPKHAIRMAREHLVHAHIGNCAMDYPHHPAYGDMHPRFGMPGTRNDVHELAEYLKCLVEVGYLSKEKPRVVSFEVKPMPEENPEAVLAGCKRTLEAAWRRLRARQ